MLLKVRIRRYTDGDAIAKGLLEYELAQNVEHRPEYISGDFVDEPVGSYMHRVREFGRHFDCEVEVVPSGDVPSVDDMLERYKQLPPEDQSKIREVLRKMK